MNEEELDKIYENLKGSSDYKSELEWLYDNGTLTLEEYENLSMELSEAGKIVPKANENPVGGEYVHKDVNYTKRSPLETVHPDKG
jgi:hypothetical protein